MQQCKNNSTDQVLTVSDHIVPADPLTVQTRREEQSPQIVYLLHMFHQHSTHTHTLSCDNTFQPGSTNPFCTWSFLPSACWESKVRPACGVGGWGGGYTLLRGPTMRSEQVLSCSWRPKRTEAATATSKHRKQLPTVRSVRR